MVMITLAGSSTRFFNQGFNTVKYKLLYNKTSILENILSYIPNNLKLCVVLNKKFNDDDYVKNIILKLNFNNFKIIELNDTKGQLETLMLALEQCDDFINEEEEIVVYNGDTIRKLLNWSNFNSDGFIEVFESDGEHWSFVDNIGIVNYVKEKVRISKYCSSGFYHFRNKNILFQHYNNYLKNVSSELYIAPFYQYLIDMNYKIKSELVSKESFVFCGTPNEYLLSLKNNNN